MKNKNYTWIIKNDKGEIINRTSFADNTEHRAIYWGKLKDIIKVITLKEYLDMSTIEIYNPSDKVKHRPITKEQVINMLKENEENENI